MNSEHTLNRGKKYSYQPQTLGSGSVRTAVALHLTRFLASCQKFWCVVW